jgi:hypothetical protein
METKKVITSTIEMGQVTSTFRTPQVSPLVFSSENFAEPEKQINQQPPPEPDAPPPEEQR